MMMRTSRAPPFPTRTGAHCLAGFIINTCHKSILGLWAVILLVLLQSNVAQQHPVGITELAVDVRQQYRWKMSMEHVKDWLSVLLGLSF